MADNNIGKPLTMVEKVTDPNANTNVIINDNGYVHQAAVNDLLKNSDVNTSLNDVKNTLTNIKQGSTDKIKYIDLSTAVIVSINQQPLSAGFGLGIPNLGFNMVITLRNESIGGITNVVLAANGVITPSAGATNFSENHLYSGSFVYLR